MNSRKRFRLFTLLFVMVILLVGCKQKSVHQIDWEKVNAALNEGKLDRNTG